MLEEVLTRKINLLTNLHSYYKRSMRWLLRNIAALPWNFWLPPSPPFIYPKSIQVNSLSVMPNVLISGCQPGLWNGQATARGPARATHHSPAPTHTLLMIFPSTALPYLNNILRGNSGLELGQLLWPQVMLMAVRAWSKNTTLYSWTSTTD